mgnify:FL=1
MIKNSKNQWDLVITPHRGWFNLDIVSLWKYRDLILLFVRRDLVSIHKQTILGPLYFIITPIIATLISTLIFGKIAQLSTDGIPQFLFYMSGNLFWTYFSTCLNAGKSIFSANESLFSQVYFPRLTVPISQAISAFIKLIIQFILFAGFYYYFTTNGMESKLSFQTILIPLLLFQCSLLGIGTGILISSFTVKYKDLNFLYTFIVSLWMYLSPIVYPLSTLPKKWHYLISCNPMVGIVETARKILFGISSIESTFILNGLITTVVMLFIGLIIFNRVEKTFLDSV